MNAGSDRYSEWDAAYLLGSLSASDRREFERHLGECASCADAVAELAGLPGLLSKVPAASAVRLIEEPQLEASLPATLLPRLVRSARRRRRRALVITSAAAAVAAVVAAVLLITLVLPAGGPLDQHASTAISLDAVTPNPLKASVRLVAESWGTRVEMNCQYATSGRPPYPTTAPHRYSMWVTDAAGTSTEVATWSAGPGQTAEPAGTTSLAFDQIRTVDIRSVDSGKVLLEGSR
jgi:RNA polymerase sigma-70 factor (ECF subfamily)